MQKKSCRKFTTFAVQTTQSHPIAKLGTYDGFTAETSLSKNASTGMSTSEMVATEVFTTKISANKMSTAEMTTAEIFLIKIYTTEMSTNEIFLIKIPTTEMSTAETSGAKMSAAECQLIKNLHLGYWLVKCLPLNSYYWACTKKVFY